MLFCIKQATTKKTFFILFSSQIVIFIKLMGIQLWLFILDNLIGRALAESNLSKQSPSNKRDASENDKEQDSLKDKVNSGKDDNSNRISFDSKPTGV